MVPGQTRIGSFAKALLSTLTIVASPRGRSNTFAPKRLGLNLLAGEYAWHDLTNPGAIIAGGSDAPVERGDPMIEFYAAWRVKVSTAYQMKAGTRSKQFRVSTRSGCSLCGLRSR